MKQLKPEAISSAHSFCIFEDINEREKADEKLIRSKKGLKRKMKELECFYDIAVGMVLRMIELKKETERLTEKL